MASSADPGQLASSEANWSGSALFANQGISGFSRTRVKEILVYVQSTQKLKKLLSRRINAKTIYPFTLVEFWSRLFNLWIWLIVLGFNDTSTLMGHFVSSPREREKRDRRDSRRDEREGQGRKRNRNESEETEEMKISPPYPYLLQG